MRGLQVERLDHLGIMARVCQEIELAATGQSVPNQLSKPTDRPPCAESSNALKASNSCTSTRQGWSRPRPSGSSRSTNRS
jgi:hypothetical protein